jgi:hypothetical protein
MTVIYNIQERSFDDPTQRENIKMAYVKDSKATIWKNKQ